MKTYLIHLDSKRTVTKIDSFDTPASAAHAYKAALDKGDNVVYALAKDDAALAKNYTLGAVVPPDDDL